LLAQVVEEVSILAAERRRQEPKTVPRPQHVRGQGKTPQSWGTPLAERQAAPAAAPVKAEPEGADPAYAGAMGMLAGSARGPGSRTGGDPS
jgi:hypothetical protein